MTRKALGRGLGALIPGAPEPGSEHSPQAPPAPTATAIDGAADSPHAVAATLPADALPAGERVTDLALDRIRPNPRQPRVEFDEALLFELAESIRAQGVLQPVLVRPSGDGDYQLVAGERRFRASKLLGLPTIPAIVRSVDDDELLELALIENLQREDLNPIEEALGYQRLIDELRYTHEKMSERVGRNRSSITNSLRLLSLPGGVQVMVSRGTLSAGHARALLGLASAAEIEASARYVVDMGLSVRKTEALVARKLRRKIATRRPRGSADGAQVAVDSVSSTYAEWLDALRRRFATQVRIVPEAHGERGRIELEYYNETDLERLLELLGVM
ncbi:MAG: ParB/RepB/Spo0J family partition protein [Betaproteobacteria bacterium]